MDWLVCLQGIENTLINCGDFIQVVFENSILVVYIDRAVEMVILAESSMGKGFKILWLFTAGHIQAVNNMLAVEVILQVDAHGEMAEQDEANILSVAACKFMIYLIF